MRYVEFGKIVTTHGIKGELKVDTYTTDIKRLLKLQKVYVEKVEYLVKSIRNVKNQLVIALNGVDCIEKVETLKLIGKMISRQIELQEEQKKDEFFVSDLIGSTVVLQDGTKMGTLTEVFQTGANDVYEVLKTDNTKMYLPAISSVVLSVDIRNKIIVVALMEGL